MTNLSRSALVGVTSNFAGVAVLVVAQVASTAATSRLVAPGEFGAYAAAQAAAGLAGYFTMSALGSGLLRRSEFGPKTVGTAAVISLSSAGLVTLALLIGAYPWAAAWGVPSAADVVRVVAIALFLNSAATVPIALIRRHLRFGMAAGIETGSQVVGLAVGVGLALSFHSALALASGQAAGGAALVVGAAVVAQKDLQLGFDRVDARELITFSTQVSGLGLGSYAMNTAPSWFTARAFGPFALGLYSRASLIAFLPLTYLAASITKVLYPLYGRVRGDLTRTKILVDEGLALATGLVWPLFALLAGAAPVVVEVLLGPAWPGAAPLIALCALAACANLPCGLLTNAAEALGWMRVIGLRQTAFFISLVVVMVVTYAFGLSLNWLVAGVAACEWFTYAWTLQAFAGREFLDARVVLKSQLSHGAIALGTFGAAASCAYLLDSMSLALQIGAEALLAIALMATAYLAKSWIPAGQILSRRLLSARNQAAEQVR